MIELLTLGFVLFVVGPIVLLGLGLVALPLFLLFKAVGFAVRLSFGLIGGLLGLAGALLAGIFLLPVLAVVGGLLLIKLLLLAAPLLLLVGIVWLVVHLSRDSRQTVAT